MWRALHRGMCWIVGCAAACLTVLLISAPAEALTISNVQIVPTDHTFTATWTTDELANTELRVEYVKYGGGGGGTKGDHVLMHEFGFSDLPASTELRITVSSTTPQGQHASAGPFVVMTLDDVTPPQVTDVRIDGTSSRAARVSWRTNESSYGAIDYGTDLSYGQTVESNNTLTGLQPRTAYQFQVRATDVAGNMAIPSGNFTVSTDTLWSQGRFEEGGPSLYYHTCVSAVGAPTCASPYYRDVWPREMSWTGNEFLIQFVATPDDLARGPLIFELNVIYTQSKPIGDGSMSKSVILEVAAGTTPSTLVVINPGGVTIDQPGAYSVPVPANVFAPGLNYLRLKATTINEAEMGPGQFAPVAVWNRMQLRWTEASPAQSDEQLLDRTEAQAARYFWEQAFNTNGFVRDLTNSPSASMAATGFGLGALAVMAGRYGTSSEWIVTPFQAQARAQKILDAAAEIQQRQAEDPFHYGRSGLFYHFIDAAGQRVAQDGVSTIDSALFLAGVATAGQYFKGTVRTRANEIFSRVRWADFYQLNPNAGHYQFNHGWVPEGGAQGTFFSNWWDRPGDETLLVNLLALASDPSNAGFRESLYNWLRTVRSYAGYDVVNSYFGSLFTYIFGQCFFDFKAMGQDNPSGVGASVQPVNWFANAKNAVLANRQFAIDQSGQFPTYSSEQWGMSACYRPDGSYFGANSAPPLEANGGQPSHDGTVPPYGAISTMPLVRESADEPLGSNLAFQALRNDYDHHYAGLWGPYGPRDSLKTVMQDGQPVTAYSPLYVGIDVGPEALMIENYRSGLIHRLFMSHPKIRQAIRLQFPQANIKVLIDLSGDGVVTINELIKAVLFALGRLKPSPQELAASDRNGDGQVTVDEIIIGVNNALEGPDALAVAAARRGSALQDGGLVQLSRRLSLMKHRQARPQPTQTRRTSHRR